MCWNTIIVPIFLSTNEIFIEGYNWICHLLEWWHPHRPLMLLCLVNVSWRVPSYWGGLLLPNAFFVVGSLNSVWVLPHYYEATVVTLYKAIETLTSISQFWTPTSSNSVKTKPFSVKFLVGGLLPEENIMGKFERNWTKHSCEMRDLKISGIALFRKSFRTFCGMLFSKIWFALFTFLQRGLVSTNILQLCEWLIV